MARRPFIVKGVMTQEAREKAKEAGADAIIVSNHERKSGWISVRQLQEGAGREVVKVNGSAGRFCWLTEGFAPVQTFSRHFRTWY